MNPDRTGCSSLANFKFFSEASAPRSCCITVTAHATRRSGESVARPTMLVDRDKFRFAYEELKADGRLCPVHVYVSTADVDSCCAFRILKSMMCSDGIPFSAYPVSGYQELQNLGEKLPKDGQNRSIVLINCGGTENVKELLGASPPALERRMRGRPARLTARDEFKSRRSPSPQPPTVTGLPEGTRVFVFDSHRPLDLENTRSDNRDVPCCATSARARDLPRARLRLWRLGPGLRRRLRGGRGDEDDGDEDEDDGDKENAGDAENVNEDGASKKSSKRKREEEAARLASPRRVDSAASRSSSSAWRTTAAAPSTVAPRVF